MARKSKKLQELQMLFDENDLDFLLINDKRIQLHKKSNIVQL